MKRTLIYLAGILAIFSSCSKDELTIKINNAGSLIVKTLDAQGEPLSKVEIIVDQWSDELYNDSTDSNGFANVGALIEGTYQVKAYYKKNNLEYVQSKATQVIAGKQKELLIDPLSNTSNVEIELYTEEYVYGSGYVETPLSNMNVAIVPFKIGEEYWDLDSEDRTISWINNNASLKGTSNSKGIVIIDGIPLPENFEYYMEYYAFIYKTLDDEFITQNNIYINGVNNNKFSWRISL